MKQQRYVVRWVPEKIYNHYQGVDPNKKRPVLVWDFSSQLNKDKSLCFYCSTKIDKFNSEACVLIKKSENKYFKDDTYIWLHRPLFVCKWHYLPNAYTRIQSATTRHDIKDKIVMIYSRCVEITK